MMSVAPVLVWLRRSLRLNDNPLWAAALKYNQPVIPVFLWTPEEDGHWSLGGASQWWLHHSLKAFNQSLEGLGSRLIIRQGNHASSCLSELIQETGASLVLTDWRPEPEALKQTDAAKKILEKDGIPLKTVLCHLIFHPDAIRTGQGTPYKVYTPFSRQCLSQPIPTGKLLEAPTSLPEPGQWPKSESLASLNLLPTLDWADGFTERWTPGETGATQHLDRFVKNALEDYKTGRDRPDQHGTSRLSPHLHFGEISPREIWVAVHQAVDKAHGYNKQMSASGETYLKEILWREFAYHLLYHFPHTPLEPLKPEYDSFPWRNAQADLKRWQTGQTGYPIVDAGMRELWATGWMHNRVRMIVASFLIKDLRIAWQEGAHWFWDTLVDADLASNTLGWQWAAGSGADAAPFFRIFNPISQSEKFDPDGQYIRRWIPELKDFSNKAIHKPWTEPLLLQESGYPEPIVDHSEARKEALAAYEIVKEKSRELKAGAPA